MGLLDRAQVGAFWQAERETEGGYLVGGLLWMSSSGSVEDVEMEVQRKLKFKKPLRRITVMMLKCLIGFKRALIHSYMI